MAKSIIGNGGFSSTFKLWNACDGDSRNEALAYVHFSGGYAYASNAHILVRIPLDRCTGFDEEERSRLAGKSIHMDLLKYLSKYDNLSVVDHEYVDEDGEEVKTACIEGWIEKCRVSVDLATQDMVRRPDFEKVLSVGIGTRKRIEDIGVNAGLLSKLVSAMGAENIKMQFTKADGKIFIEPVSDVEASGGVLGLIMPIAVTGTLDGFDEAE